MVVTSIVLKPPVDKDNKMVDGQYIDVEQLELLDDKIKVTKRSNTGGSKTDAPKGL